jgi:hypothetical protein
MYMTDNGMAMTNCGQVPSAGQDSLTYLCTVTYGESNVGNHVITGVFLGDATHGQSAGQIDEMVQATATTTTTVPAPTTTVAIWFSIDELGSISEIMSFSFDVTYTPSINSDPGTNTLYVDGAIPPTCPQDDNNTETCVLPPTSDPTLGGNASVQIDFVPGTYTITDTHSAAGIYPSSQAQAIIVNAS